VVVALVALSACGSADPTPAQTGAPGMTTGDIVTTDEQPSQPEDTMTDDPGAGDPEAELPEPLTEADDGAWVELALGDEIAWRLSSDWDWEEPVADSGSVQFVPVDYFADPGYREWLVVGAAPGTAELSARGASACGDPQECPDRTVTITVDVSR
jgi:hypothetical protein